MNTPSKKHTIAVIGAGIVGLSVATRLHRDGHSVTVIDRDDPMEGCSAGNAGYLSEANIFPPAAPDMLAQLPRLLLSRTGPLVIRPSYLAKMLPWTIRALSVVKPEARRRVTDALAVMTRHAYVMLADLAGQSGAAHLLSRDGGLVAFKSPEALDKKCDSLGIWNGYGLEVRRVSSGEIHELEPALVPEIVGGLYFQNSGRCSNPKGLGLIYADRLRAQDARILRENVRRIQIAGDGSVEIAGAERTRRFDRVVVCAGYWSGELLRPFVRCIPLVSERGYHMMVPNPGFRLSRPVVFGEPHFAATPMDDGLRLAGTAEFTAPQSPPNMRRATMLLKLAGEYLKPISSEGATPWMGIRPSLPDGLPAVGRVSGMPQILYAFGHAHNGLTLSAVTAHCIAALVRGERSFIEMGALNLNRFEGNTFGDGFASAATSF